MSFIYIFLTIFFTVYGQLIIKWQTSLAGNFPTNFSEKLIFIFKLLMNPWIISGFLAAFLASLCWIATVSKFPLSFAYPFMSLSFVLILFLSALFFAENITWQKLLGMGLIIGGVLFISQS